MLTLFHFESISGNVKLAKAKDKGLIKVPDPSVPPIPNMRR